MSRSRKSVERRLYDAWRANKGGIRLTVEELEMLLEDDAMQTRITNQLGYELGLKSLACGGLPGSSLWGSEGSYRTFKNEVLEVLAEQPDED